jgi:hypothetical protein
MLRFVTFGLTTIGIIWQNCIDCIPRLILAMCAIFYQRLDAGRRFPSVVPWLLWLVVYCVGAATMRVATLSVSFPTSCLLASVDSWRLNMVFWVGVDTTVVATLGVLFSYPCRVPTEAFLGLIWNFVSSSVHQRRVDWHLWTHRGQMWFRVGVATLGNGFPSSCRMSSWGLSWLNVVFWVGVVSIGIPRLIWTKHGILSESRRLSLVFHFPVVCVISRLNLVFWFSVATVGVATIGVVLPQSCRLASLDSARLNMVFWRDVATSGVPSLDVGFPTSCGLTSLFCWILFQ